MLSFGHADGRVEPVHVQRNLMDATAYTHRCETRLLSVFFYWRGLDELFLACMIAFTSSYHMSSRKKGSVCLDEKLLPENWLGNVFGLHSNQSIVVYPACLIQQFQS